MNILILGSGGREHALAWAIRQNPKCDRLIVAPGNAGIAALARCAQLAITDGAAVVAFCEEHAIDLVVIGPEAPLAAGVADALRAAGVAVFGPSRAAAMLEASKAFTKEICDACGAPTAAWARFADAAAARAHVARTGAPIVVKADGLAAGKGVTVAMSVPEAEAAIDAALSEAAQLAAMLPAARSQAWLSAVSGQKAFDGAAASISALAQARSHMVDTHNTLAALARLVTADRIAEALREMAGRREKLAALFETPGGALALGRRLGRRLGLPEGEREEDLAALICDIPPAVAEQAKALLAHKTKTARDLGQRMLDFLALPLEERAAQQAEWWDCLHTGKGDLRKALEPFDTLAAESARLRSFQERANAHRLLAATSALLVAAGLLWFYGRFTDITILAMCTQTVVLGFAAMLGASAGRLLLQPS